MTGKIDAHVHLVPGYLRGCTDPRFQVTVEDYGIKRFADGGIYQFMPDYMADSRFETETLLHCLDNQGIEQAVIMQSPAFSMNEAVVRAVQTYPERLKGAMIIEPRDESCLKEIIEYRRRGLTVIKFEMSAGLGFGHPGLYPELRLDAGLLGEVWEIAAQKGLTVTVDPGPIGGPGYQIVELRRVAQRFPALHLVICHLGLPCHGLKQDTRKYRLWQSMLSLAEFPNIWFDTAALPALFVEEEYPYPTALEYLSEFISRYGCEKAIWGSDIPGTWCYGTYSQLWKMFDSGARFSQAEKERLFGLNARAAYHW